MSRDEESDDDILNDFADFQAFHGDGLPDDLLETADVIRMSYYGSSTAKLSVKERDIQDWGMDFRRGPQGSSESHVPKRIKYSRTTIRGKRIEEVKAFSGIGFPIF